MASDNQNATLLMGQLDGKIELARNILARLDSQALLSPVLNSVRGLATLNTDAETVALIDLMIYGHGNVPGLPIPYDDPVYVRAAERFWSIFSIPNLNGILSQIKQGRRDIPPQKDQVLAGPVHALEESEAPSRPSPFDSEGIKNLYLRQQILHHETQGALNRARAEIHRYAFHALSEATFERDALSLLGPDYRIALDSLRALDTQVGKELEAALTALRSDNPASWSLAALGCRNVVLRLGQLLWKRSESEYCSHFHKKVLPLVADKAGGKEVNRLCAYVDEHYKNVSPKNKRLLEEAHALLHDIYKEGSKGKGGSGAVRCSHAQKLVVDTFRFVDILRQVTRLGALETIAAAQ